jgi:nitroimidazol reductase NimA-like FMN-containing flavoprotein (pyridoxamine 5'-phosphate oxidase superfamily)
MPKLTDDEIHEFLHEPGHLARIGTIDDDGMPRVLPLWFVVEDGLLWFTPRAPAVIWRNIQRDPRVGMSIDEEASPYRKVTLQGVVDIVHPPGEDDRWRDRYRRIARRYTPAEWADAYVDGVFQARVAHLMRTGNFTTPCSASRSPSFTSGRHSVTRSSLARRRRALVDRHHRLERRMSRPDLVDVLPFTACRHHRRRRLADRAALAADLDVGTTPSPSTSR